MNSVVVKDLKSEDKYKDKEDLRLEDKDLWPKDKDLVQGQGLVNLS